MRTRRLTGFTLTLLSTIQASAQGPSAPSPAPTVGASASEGSDGAFASSELAGSSGATEDTGASASSDGAAASRTGFETGLRLGFGVPVGRGGRSLEGAERDLSDLTSWRAPLWLDIGYRLSQVTTLGAYAQLGVGGNGDACAGECDWSDIRIGAQAQWRFAPGSNVSPWLGVGLGYEWLSFRTLVSVPLPDPGPDDPDAIPVRTAELLGGPELLLQGGLDFKVEDSFSVGPYASATVGQYLSDRLRCDPRDFGCPEVPSIDGSGLHSWLGVGLRGTYTP